MEEKRKKAAVVLALLGFILIVLSLSFPWFIFSGMAEHARGTVEVSGSVSAFGSGTITSGARVKMWSSATQWTRAGSDFWYGYLNVAGLILVSASVLFLFLLKKTKISSLLTFMGCALAASASLMGILYYKPQIFVISGFIYGAPPGIDTGLLYATQAVVKTGLGPWLSLFGALLCAMSMALAYRLYDARLSI